MSDTRWWSKLDDARLAVLWAEGHAASAIGREMGRTKNGIIGRAHRLHLAPRPSPLPNQERVAVEPALHIAPPPVVVAPVPLPASPRMPGVSRCQYPEGDPREPGFHYCEAPVVGAGPYCATHEALCWTGRARAA